jgi:hypothetical protein
MFNKSSKGLGLVVGAALSLLLVAMPMQQTCAQEWATYTNEEVGFSIDFPANWKIDENVEEYEEEVIAGAMFLSPKYSSSGEGPCLFAATEEIEEEGESIRGHVQGDIDEADGTAESWGERTVSGEEAVTTVVSFPDEGTKSYMVHFWMPGEEGSIVMMLEGETDEDRYDDDFDEYFDPMVSSFKLL